MSATKIRILCVDDHAEIRRLFSLVMEDRPEFEVVGTSESAEDLEAKLEELAPDVVVLDISMPGREPLDAMKAAITRFPSVRFLVASSYDHGPMVQKAFSAGATGYLVKGAPFDEMADAIRNVARGVRVTPRRAPWHLRAYDPESTQ
jgi:DNA-binding NarL/FixJ family response regulator